MKDELEALVMRMYKGGILYSEALREFKKRFVLTVLEENHGNQCKAARQLGMHRNTLSRTIVEMKIDMQQLHAKIKQKRQAEMLASRRAVRSVLASQYAAAM